MKSITYLGSSKYVKGFDCYRVVINVHPILGCM